MMGATIYMIDVASGKVSRIDSPSLGWPAYFKDNFESLWGDFKKKYASAAGES